MQIKWTREQNNKRKKYIHKTTNKTQPTPKVRNLAGCS
jgi:hypothetical protein